MKTRSFAVASLLLSGSLLAAAAARADQVDDYVQAQMQKQKIPGLALAVVRDGEVVKAKGYGLANVELNVPVSPETIFQSGSVGKQFTATLVTMLAREGKIGLDDPVGKYITEAPPAWKGITVRHLLTHTSGISNGLYAKIDMRHDFTEDELIREIAALPLDFQPGERWSYSNLGYVTLGILVHRATGKFYGDLLREKIFTPLGMTTARIIDEADIVPNRAAGYRLVDGQLKNQEWVSPSLNTTADGSLYLTLLDMVKWDAGLAGDKLLPRAALDEMWTPVKLNDGTTRPYGFGWEVASTRGHRVIRHGGAWQGFTTDIARYVDDKLTVIVLTNLAGASPERIGRGVAGLYEAALAPEEHRIIHVDPKVFEDYSGTYELTPGRQTTIYVRDGKLWWQQGLNAVELAPESETTFYLEAADARVKFVRGADGKVTNLVVDQGGFEMPAKRLPPSP